LGVPADNRHAKNTLDSLAVQFHRFGERECRGSCPLYESLSHRIAEDSALLSLALDTRRGQLAPNVFFAAVQYLLYDAGDDQLRNWYPGLGGTRAVEPLDSAFVEFRRFCSSNSSEIRQLLKTRVVQTNEVRRNACFLPALELVSRSLGGRGFRFVDIGASAGFNLLWNRCEYAYGSNGSLRPPTPALTITCEVRGSVTPPIPQRMPYAHSAVGVELEPIDPSDEDAVRWLRSLIFPNHLDRFKLFDAAVREVIESPPDVRRGDARECLPEMIEEMPEDEPAVLLFSYSMNQIFPDGLDGARKLLTAASVRRRLFEVALGYFGGSIPVLMYAEYENGRPMMPQHKLANCHTHGAWLEWTPSDKEPHAYASISSAS
jgi:hypothetical protein